jgi:integrase
VVFEMLRSPKYPHRYADKLRQPVTLEEFTEKMKQAHFVKPQHAGLVTFIYYTGVRVMEGCQHMTREQFHEEKNTLYCNIGQREKHSHETPELPLLISYPFMDKVLDSLQGLKPEEKVWDYSRTTAWLIVKRVCPKWYPHYFRMSRISYWLSPHPEFGKPQGYSILEVRNWTGLSVRAFDWYIGQLDIEKMGAQLVPPPVV